MRVEAMPATPTTPTRARRARLPRWLGVVFPVVILAALGFAFVQATNRTIVPLALSLALTTGLGLASGFVTRWTLRNQGGWVRASASLAAVVVGLLMLGLATRGQAGVGPLSPPLAQPNWEGLGRVALAALAAWLALFAWPPGQERRGGADRWRALLARFRARWEVSALHRGLDRVRNGFGWARAWIRPSRPRAAAASLAPRVRLRAHSERSPRWGWNMLERIRERLGRPNAALRGRRRPPRSRASRNIRLMKVEEHRCPYCLDVVEPNDPRGVKVCRICRTRHHADCWEITGMCQVPHDHAGSH